MTTVRRQNTASTICLNPRTEHAVVTSATEIRTQACLAPSAAQTRMRARCGRRRAGWLGRRALLQGRGRADKAVATWITADVSADRPITAHRPARPPIVRYHKRTQGARLHSVSSFDSHRLHPPSLHHFRGDAESGNMLAISTQVSAVADLPQPGRHSVASRCAIQSMVPHLVFRDPHHTNEVRRVSQTLYHKHHIGDKFGC